MTLSTSRIAPNLTSASSLALKSVAGKVKPKCLTLKKIYIEQIRAGLKTVEGRILKGTVTKLKKGDLLRFYYYTNAKDDVICKVLQINKHPTFKEMLQVKGYANCIPDARNFETAVKAYGSIPGYPEKEKKFGVA